MKRNGEHALDFASHFPLGGLLFWLRAITVNPALVTSDNPKQEGCITGCDLAKQEDFMREYHFDITATIAYF
jgi:hypothetical protein